MIPWGRVKATEGREGKKRKNERERERVSETEKERRKKAGSPFKLLAMFC